MMRLPLSSLPGPRTHLDAVTADLNDGFSCVWLVPDELVANGLAEELLGVLSARPDSVRVPAPEPDRPPLTRWSRQPPMTQTSTSYRPAWMREAISRLELDRPFIPDDDAVVEMRTPIIERLAALFDPSQDTASDPLTDMANCGRLSGRVIVVCAWEEAAPDDVGSLLMRITALNKSMGIPPGQRPRVLVAGRESDILPTTRDRVDPVTTKVHWWWGVCGRLDTAVVVADSKPAETRRFAMGRREGLRDRIAAEVLVEVAGPDLDLARHLASVWNGRIETLRDRIKEFAYDLEVPMPRRAGWPVAANRPPQEARSAWASGQLDLWEGQVRVSPAVDAARLTDIDLSALVWRGQSRALTPVVDDYRAQLERKIRARASMSVLGEMCVEDRAGASETDLNSTLELGAMAWAVATRRVRLPRLDADLLFCLRNIRNALAHLRPLSDEDLDRLIQVLPNEV